MCFATHHAMFSMSRIRSDLMKRTVLGVQPLYEQDKTITHGEIFSLGMLVLDLPSLLTLVNFLDNELYKLKS
jgi:hypothetical protein